MTLLSRGVSDVQFGSPTIFQPGQCAFGSAASFEAQAFWDLAPQMVGTGTFSATFSGYGDGGAVGGAGIFAGCCTLKTFEATCQLFYVYH